jgi:hypothetical protein
MIFYYIYTKDSVTEGGGEGEERRGRGRGDK